MDHEEALKIAEIISYSDGGCAGCVGDLMERCQVQFPEHDWWDLMHEALPAWVIEYRIQWETKEKFLESVSRGVRWDDRSE